MQKEVMQKEVKPLGELLRESNRKKIDRLIFTCYHLSILQSNLFKEVGQLLDDSSDMKHDVKHNHKKIAELLKGQYKDLGRKWMNASERDIELFSETSDMLEKDVREWFGIQ